MTKQGSVWLVVSFLLLTVGIVYALSVTSPPPQKTEATVAQSPASHGHSHPHASAEASEEIAFSPDMSQVNPFHFLDPVSVGKAAPDFTAQAADGKTIRLSDYQGKKNVVLVFYQGNFCSVCGAQLSNLQKHMADFKNQDAEILAISADDQPHALQTLANYGLSFPVIPDAEKAIIQKFGIANIARKNIAYPSLFIVDKQGTVQFSFADAHGHRLHSNEILPELSKLTGKPAPKLGYND